MSHYHIFLCERCGHAAKGNCNGDPPQYWTRVIFRSQLGRDSRKDEEADLCGSCYSLMTSLVRHKDMELIDLSIYERALKVKT